MSVTHWIAFAAIALISLGAVLYLYHRREPAGRGRNLLAALRWLALALLILLLFDPRLKQPLDRNTANRETVLLDGSLSMLLPAKDGESQWAEAVKQATSRAASRDVMLFGDAGTLLHPDTLAHVAPAHTHSTLLPALQSASESGADVVTIVTDGDIEDADAVARWIPRLGMQVNWVHTSGAAFDLALTEMNAPAWGEAGKPLDITIGVQSIGAESRKTDSVTVTLRQDGVVLATQRIAVPATGRTTSAHVTIKPRAPNGGGYVRIEATVDDGAFADDNVRNAYVYVSDEPAGIVLVSLAPDWEPRFLLPVLERAVALPARGYLRSGNGAWVRVGGGLDAGIRVTDDVVQKAVRNADLLVIHNASRSEPAWVNDAMKSAPRLIVLPGSDANGIPAPIPVASATPGDWFASAEVPPSPVAPLLTGLRVDDVPPLEAAIAIDVPAGTWSPLAITRGRRGAPSPIAVAGEMAGRRWAIGLGLGYWRWAFQGGASGDVYNRLWSSVGGWIMRDARSADIAAVRPVDRAVMRGEPIRWVSRTGVMDSVRVTVTKAGAPSRTEIIRAQRDTAVMSDIAYGTYRFDATAYRGKETVSSSGDVTVEANSPEFARHSATLLNSKATTSALRAGGRDTKPLHASWLPYALLLLLLATEWILRRRWGLR